MHILIIGASGTGKTTLAMMLASRAALTRRQVLVYDITGPYGWPGKHFDSIDAYMRAVKTHKNCLLVVDESTAGLDKFDRSTYFLTTTARHLGHKTIIVGHRLRDIAPAIRSNCTTIFAFAGSKNDYKILQDENDCTIDTSKLAVFEFVRLQRGIAPEKMRLDIGRRVILKCQHVDKPIIQSEHKGNS